MTHSPCILASLALTAALVAAAGPAPVEGPQQRPVRHVDLDAGSANVVWAERQSECFGLLTVGDTAAYLALGAEGATIGSAISPWHTQREGLPEVIDYSPSRGVLSVLLGDAASGLELLRVSRSGGGNSQGNWDLDVIGITRPSNEHIVAAALVGRAASVQVAVITTMAGDEQGSDQSSHLHVGRVEGTSLQWTKSIPLGLGDRDEDALVQLRTGSLASMAIVDLGEVQYVALGLPEWGPRTGALLVWRMDDWKRPDSRRLINWNGTADLDRGRHTRLGCTIVLATGGGQSAPTLYTAAPEAGLEAAALAFRCDTGERVGMHNPLVDRWAQGSEWRRLSPSSVVAGISDACVFVVSGDKNALIPNPRRAGAILRFGAGVRGRSILDEVR